MSGGNPCDQLSNATITQLGFPVILPGIPFLVTLGKDTPWDPCVNIQSITAPGYRLERFGDVFYDFFGPNTMSFYLIAHINRNLSKTVAIFSTVDITITLEDDIVAVPVYFRVLVSEVS